MTFPWAFLFHLIPKSLDNPVMSWKYEASLWLTQLRMSSKCIIRYSTVHNLRQRPAKGVLANRLEINRDSSWSCSQSFSSKIVLFLQLQSKTIVQLSSYTSSSFLISTHSAGYSNLHTSIFNSSGSSFPISYFVRTCCLCSRQMVAKARKLASLNCYHFDSIQFSARWPGFSGMVLLSTEF